MKSKVTLALIAAACVLNAAPQQTPAAAAPQVPQQAVPQPYPVQPYAPAQQYAPPQHYYQGLPQKITSTIQQMYPGVFIRDVDFEPYGYEVELSNMMELYFDANGNLLGQKWDD
jgi:hypothetical protein